MPHQNDATRNEHYETTDHSRDILNRTTCDVNNTMQTRQTALHRGRTDRISMTDLDGGQFV